MSFNRGGHANEETKHETSDIAADTLKRHVVVLASEIGERNVFCPDAYAKAAEYIRMFWRHSGLEVYSQTFPAEGMSCANHWVEQKGAERPDEIVILGAHYDSVQGSPGANDNGSAVAALLEISKTLFRNSYRRTVRCLAFANEEPPFFQTDLMGSAVYAKGCAERQENIHAMISMDEIGYFSDEPGSQSYPPFLQYFFPDKGNFIGVAGHPASGGLVKRVKAYFEEASDFPIVSVALPREVPGIDWSDHASFWDRGFPAVMVTDTAPYRYPYYHTADDVPEHVNYPVLARVTRALAQVTVSLLNEP